MKNNGRAYNYTGSYLLVRGCEAFESREGVPPLSLRSSVVIYYWRYNNG